MACLSPGIKPFSCGTTSFLHLSPLPLNNSGVFLILLIGNNKAFRETSRYSNEEDFLLWLKIKMCSIVVTSCVPMVTLPAGYFLTRELTFERTYYFLQVVGLLEWRESQIPEWKISINQREKTGRSFVLQLCNLHHIPTWSCLFVLFGLQVFLYYSWLCSELGRSFSNCIWIVFISNTYLT